MFEGRFGEILFKIFMALEAKLAVGLGQQFVLIRSMWFMTRHTFTILNRLMFYPCRRDLFLDVLVAFEAKLAVRFGQQPFRVRRMRIVAGQAFTVLDGLMFRLCSPRKRIMALRAKAFPGLQQHLWVGIPMRIVARGTLSILCGLMLNFELGLKIVVTPKADLRLRPFHLYRET